MAFRYNGAQAVVKLSSYFIFSHLLHQPPCYSLYVATDSFQQDDTSVWGRNGNKIDLLRQIWFRLFYDSPANFCRLRYFCAAFSG